MRFDIVTIFPGFFDGIFAHGIVRKAQSEGLVTVETHDLRAYTHDRHRTVDDRPFGGGEGMVLKAEPLAEALEAIGIRAKSERDADASGTRVILLSAQGRMFTQAVARELAGLDRAVLICGRYEGVDERINELYCDMEISIGDYVLSGGELAAAVVIDATMRLIPGVLGNEASGEFESFGAADAEIELDVERRSALAAWSRRPSRLSALHAARGIWRSASAGSSAQWRSRPDQTLAAESSNCEDVQKPPGLLDGAALSAEDRRLIETLRQTEK